MLGDCVQRGGGEWKREGGRCTGSNNIVNNKHSLTLLDRV